MGFVVKDNGGYDIEPIPEGMHHGICYAVYDLGTQHSDTFNNDSRQLVIIWEIPEERIEIEKDGQKLNLPRAISRMFTASLGKKANLRKTLEAWRGRVFTPEELEGFDLVKLLGVNCQLQVLHKTKDNKTYSNVVSVVPLAKGMTLKKPENPTKYFCFDENGDIPDGTPDWIVEYIQKSQEFQNGAAKQTSELKTPDWINQGGPEPTDAPAPF